MFNTFRHPPLLHMYTYCRYTEIRNIFSNCLCPTYITGWQTNPSMTAGTYSCIHIGRRVSVRVCQHGDNTEHDGLYCMDWQPALLRLLIAVLVLTRLVQNGDADIAIFCHWQQTRHRDTFVNESNARSDTTLFVEKLRKSNHLHFILKHVKIKFPFLLMESQSL